LDRWELRDSRQFPVSRNSVLQNRSLHGPGCVKYDRSSKLGEGSTFWVRFRFDRQVGATLLPRNLDAFVDTRVLIVDENETGRIFLNQQILAWRLRPECARTGEEALAMLRQAF
jgi:hypothetical protein